MKISRKARSGYALALAALLTLPCLELMQTRAADAIEVDRLCSLTVSVDKNEDDFENVKIPVSIYKVASVDSVGNYTAEDAFSQMDFGVINSETTADEWLSMAEEAARYAEDTDDSMAVTQEIQGSEGNTLEVSTKFEDLSTGMYLVVPAQVYNEDYTMKYSFIPYLTALPGNPYATVGSDGNDGYGQGTDEWIYDTTVGLKPEGEPQYGKLNITKVLANYNETLGQTSFAFLIEGRKTQDGPVVYSDVVSTTHENVGNETVTIDKIPAGLIVTVKEVYSGASYRIVGSDTDSALIWSEAAVEAGAADGAGENGETSVTFTNEYDGGNRGGYGVTNHFDSDGEGGWNWENPTEPVGE